VSSIQHQWRTRNDSKITRIRRPAVSHIQDQRQRRPVNDRDGTIGWCRPAPGCGAHIDAAPRVWHRQRSSCAPSRPNRLRRRGKPRRTPPRRQRKAGKLRQQAKLESVPYCGPHAFVGHPTSEYSTIRPLIFCKWALLCRCRLGEGSRDRLGLVCAHPCVASRASILAMATVHIWAKNGSTRR
jgi:hypothetical protein